MAEDKTFINYLREANISKYTNIMSNEDVVRELLSQSTNKDDKKAASDEDVVKAITDVFQSITTEAITVNEMIEKVYENYCGDDETKAKNVLKYLTSFMTIIHDDYNNKISEKTKKVWSFRGNMSPIKGSSESEQQQTFKKVKLSEIDKCEFPCMLLKKRPDVVGESRGWNHYSRYGMMNEKKADKLFKDTGLENGEGRALYTMQEITHSKAKVTGAADARKKHIINAVNDANYICAATKEKPSLAYILMDNPNIRAGTRNSLELATFFNLLSTVELSKCQPYLSAVFVLPSFIESQTSTKIYKTASITQFFDGTPISQDATTDVYKTLEANFTRVVGSGEDQKKQSAVGTNLSAFTMPQTINNFGEKFIGHNSNNTFNTDMNFIRSNSVHDITRPFMTIKNFSIDVAPTQGLLSFKTGKLSLILHDRTRMVDIAPFVKPDLFGSFGAEIAIEYGWRHVDGKTSKGDSTNYLGKFLDNSRVTEKYIITNSSFSMDNTGQVNIDLSIAMRGPVDIRSVKLHSDPPGLLNVNSILFAERKYLETLSILNKKGVLHVVDGATAGVSYKTITEKITQLIKDETRLVTNEVKSLEELTFENIARLKKNYDNFNKSFKKLKKSIDKQIKKIKKENELQQLLNNSRGTLSNLMQSLIRSLDKLDPKTNNTYILGDTPLISLSGVTDLKSFNLSSSEIVNGYEFYNFIKALSAYVNKVTDTTINKKSELLATQNALINKIMGGIDEIDPFINTEWCAMYEKIMLNRQVKTEGVPYQGLGRGGFDKFVTFGAFVSGLVGTHLGSTGKFNEIQIISYTCNENCGLFSNMNVSSILIPRLELRVFLNSLFEEGASFTLESVISQVINRFINTRTNVCYGLSDFYKVDPKTGNVEAVYKKDTQQLNVSKRLSKIYSDLARSEEDGINSGESSKSIDDVRFVMPKISFTFDTLTKKTDYNMTISRISIFDQNDNPFGSINTIMKDFYDRGIIAASTQLNKERQKYNSGYIEIKEQNTEETDKSKRKRKKKKLTIKEKAELAEIKNNIHKINRQKFYNRSWSIIQDLIEEGGLVEISEGIYEISGQFKVEGMKNSFKKIMPSITYGTQNSGIIEASISTVNEAKLNTIYLTRSERAADNKRQIAAKVSFSKDLPLRVLPSQATVTMYGCPFVNFAQYLFLDFETGTTIDNAYAVTGIKHDLSPGKFTTQLTLSYGDVYGKYENAANTLSRAIGDILRPNKPIKAEENITEINILNYSNSGDEIGSRRIIKNKTITFTLGEDEDKLEVSLNLNVLPSYRNIAWIEKDNQYNEDSPSFNLWMSLNNDIAKDKKINLKIDLLRDSNKFAFVKNKINKAQLGEEAKSKVVKRKRAQVFLQKLSNLKINDKQLFLSDESESNKIIKNDIDFIVNTTDNDKFLKELNNFISLKLQISFQYKGLNSTAGIEIEKNLILDWDLFERTKLVETFEKFIDLNEFNMLVMTKDYRDFVFKTMAAVKELNKSYKILINDIKASYEDFKLEVERKSKYSHMHLYTKPGSLIVSTSGIEFDVISGIKKVEEKKEKYYIDLEYQRIVIEWKTFLNSFINLEDFKLDQQ